MAAEAECVGSVCRPVPGDNLWARHKYCESSRWKMENLRQVLRSTESKQASRPWVFCLSLTEQSGIQGSGGERLFVFLIRQRLELKFVSFPRIGQLFDATQWVMGSGLAYWRY